MVLTILAFAATPALATHRNCDDFDTWRQAQRYFENANHDTSDLDRDDNGDACESLPGYQVGGNVGGGNDDDGSGDPDDDGEDGDNDGENGGGNGDLPDSSTAPLSTGAPLSLLLTALDLGTFGLVLRRRIGIRP